MTVTALYCRIPTFSMWVLWAREQQPKQTLSTDYFRDKSQIKLAFIQQSHSNMLPFTWSLEMRLQGGDRLRCLHHRQGWHYWATDILWGRQKDKHGDNLSPFWQKLDLRTRGHMWRTPLLSSPLSREVSRLAGSPVVAPVVTGRVNLVSNCSSFLLPEIWSHW